MRAIYGVVQENGKRVRRLIVLEDRKCLVCGKIFSPLTQNSIVCSRICGKKNDYKKHKTKRTQKVNEWREKNIEYVQKHRKQLYWSNPEKYRKAAKDYADANRPYKRSEDQLYKDKTRHGDLRKELIDVYGLVCQGCGVSGDSLGIVAHHISGDPTDHKNQTLLCRSCHAKIHDFGHSRKKDISSQQIENALTNFRTLDEMCKELGITRSFLRKKRIEYGFPKRTHLRGVKT